MLSARRNADAIFRSKSKSAHAERYPFPQHRFCMDGTREHILSTIMEWAQNPCSEPVFYLHGSTGSGKSTISRTIASRCVAEGILAASFINDTSNPAVIRELGELVPTILYQLIAHFPNISDDIYHLLKIDGDDVLSTTADDQLRSLLIDPILA
ncbi:hypothetical protein BDQ12DRAFT_617647, partial [Crucibulum laeve]